ncbi:MAG: 7-cyano-7-deazaguanine synthase [Armatimonadetes bacterium]|nr:7-cyano-7-deazaguanine synthase [Akkermansiaceae bacterium]
MKKRTAILLSGGIDSAAIAYWKRPEVAISIDYGQRPALGELRAASEIARALDMHHEIISINCSALGSGDLAGTAPAEGAPESEWWPYRNQLLVTLAVGRAYTLKIGRLLVGSVRSDSFHVDGTFAFYDILNQLVAIQEGGIQIEAPALDFDSCELISKSKIPLELLGWTHSCHKANYACGACRGCYKHISTLRSIESE